MDFTINNQPFTIAQDTVTLSQALNVKGLQHTRGIAVAVNQKIVSQTHWDNYALQPHDHILIITATQGG